MNNVAGAHSAGAHPEEVRPKGSSWNAAPPPTPLTPERSSQVCEFADLPEAFSAMGKPCSKKEIEVILEAAGSSLAPLTQGRES